LFVCNAWLFGLGGGWAYQLVNLNETQQSPPSIHPCFPKTLSLTSEIRIQKGRAGGTLAKVKIVLIPKVTYYGNGWMWMVLVNDDE
jgi:hypothetical protein